MGYCAWYKFKEEISFRQSLIFIPEDVSLFENSRWKIKKEKNVSHVFQIFFHATPLSFVSVQTLLNLTNITTPQREKFDSLSQFSIRKSETVLRNQKCNSKNDFFNYIYGPKIITKKSCILCYLCTTKPIGVKLIWSLTNEINIKETEGQF